MVQIGKFQCLSYSEFPEFFKTHPTLICRSIVKASRSLQTNRQCYLIALVYYQMDHIWWASGRLKISVGHKMRSQLSYTLFHLSVATLYIYIYMNLNDNKYIYIYMNINNNGITWIPSYLYFLIIWTNTKITKYPDQTNAINVSIVHLINVKFLW